MENIITDITISAGEAEGASNKENGRSFECQAGAQHQAEHSRTSVPLNGKGTVDFNILFRFHFFAIQHLLYKC